MAIQTYTMKIVDTKDIAPQTGQITLASPNDFSFIAGQFISLNFNINNKEYKRSYSISSPPTQKDKLEFVISYISDGIASNFLKNVKINDSIQVTGPAGRLVLLNTPPKRYIFVATGTGVTPYRAMLPEIIDILKKGHEIILLFGVKNKELCLFRDEFIAIAEKYPNFIFKTYYSRQLPDPTDKYAHQGRLQVGLHDLELYPDSDIIYLCGNPNMIDECYKLLQEKGFTARNVKREKYISSK